ncbi:MAG: DUF3617 family protein [Lysobacteraceae bacterium]
MWDDSVFFHRPGHRMIASSIRMTFAAAIALIAVPALAHAEPGQMMHMSVTGKVQLEDPPIKMEIPAISKDVCSPKEIDVRHLMTETSRNMDCTYSDYKQEGKTVRFHMACAGSTQMDGDASFTMDNGGVHGTVHAKSNTHGQATVVDMQYTGITSGTACEYTPPKAAK